MLDLSLLCGSWEAEPWSVCSRTCGAGIQTRRIECRQRYSENMSVPITASLCNFAARPRTSQECEVKPCAEWRAGNWSKVFIIVWIYYSGPLGSWIRILCYFGLKKSSTHVLVTRWTTSIKPRLLYSPCRLWFLRNFPFSHNNSLLVLTTLSLQCEKSITIFF